MEFYIYFGLLVFFYFFLYLFDAIMKSKSSFNYLKLLRWSGLDIGLLQIRWFTERFNHSLVWFGRSCTKILSVWFLIGAIVSSLLIIPAVCLLVVTLFGHFREEKEKETVVIQPVLPGVNVPNSELGYYFVSLLLCSIYHELGHAVCAASQHIRILGFGVFVLFVIPAAYVELPTEQLRAKSLLHQLKVFSAGVWHNIILVFFSYIIILALPLLTSPFYKYDAGVCVTHVNPLSSVTGPSGFKTGDEIVSISGTRIKNKIDFRQAIINAIHEPNRGYCIPNARIQSQILSESSQTFDLDCCSNSSKNNSLCFAIDDRIGTNCLQVRELLSGVNLTCDNRGDCLGDELCGRPVFSLNATKFVLIKRTNWKDFLFVGNPAVIYTSIHLSNYCPTVTFLPADLPEVVIKLCNYIISFSGALAMLNVIPSLMLDGQHMIKVLLELLMRGDYAKYRDRTQLTLTIFGTVLVIVNIALGFYTLVTDGSTLTDFFI